MACLQITTVMAIIEEPPIVRHPTCLHHTTLETIIHTTGVSETIIVEEMATTHIVLLLHPGPDMSVEARRCIWDMVATQAATRLRPSMDHPSTSLPHHTINFAFHTHTRHHHRPEDLFPTSCHHLQPQRHGHLLPPLA